MFRRKQKKPSAWLKKEIEQDLVQSSRIILATGIIMTIPAGILKITRSRKPRQSPKPQIQWQNDES
jgi:hypothetical protein